MSRHFNPWEDHFDDPNNEGVECKFCGAEGLFWVDAANGRRLADDRGLHVCPRVATADDFDVVKP